MSTTEFSQTRLVKTVVSRLLLAVVSLTIIFFLPAGTFDYWQAWVYMAALFIPMLFTLFYLIRNDPGLLERRMQTHERETEQKWIVNLTLVFFLLAFLLPGFDRRYGWSHVPPAVVVAADLLVFLGYGICILVFRENSYASRVVEVAEGQKVISTGPYAMVRHPMYTGFLLLYTASPLALGSWWAIIPAVMMAPLIIARIRNEESVLARDLPGYPEYMQSVRWRLIPKVW